MRLYGLPGNEELGRSLCRALDLPAGELEVRRFPDGESYVRVLDDPAGQRVVLLCTLDRPDAKLMPLVLLAGALREQGARSVTLAAPYLAYMRQDHRFNAGEAVSAVHFARLVSGTFDGLLTVDPHLHRIGSLDEIYTIPSRVVHAAAAMAEWLSRNAPDSLIIGPDAESAQWVSGVAEAAGVPWTVLDKERRGDREVSVSLPDLERWPERRPVLVDDIISTAHTMATAIRHIRETGAGGPACMATHAVFAGDAWEVLRQAGAGRIVTTNTIAHPTNAIDLGPIIGPALKDLLERTP